MERGNERTIENKSMWKGRKSRLEGGPPLEEKKKVAGSLSYNDDVSKRGKKVNLRRRVMVY